MPRRPIARLAAALSVTALALVPAVPAHASPGFPSDDCTPGTTLVDSFAGPTFVKVKTTQSGADTALVCVRVEGPSLTFGGKFTVATPGVTLPGAPTSDTDATACATTPGNTVPGTHPALAGSVGDPADPAYVPFLLDSFADNAGAMVCLRVGTMAVRVVVPTAFTVTPPVVNFAQDVAGSHTSTPTAPATPSGSCLAGGTATRYADVSVLGARSFLYTWQPTATVLKICVRGVSSGGVLTVDTTELNGALPSVVTASNITGCTLSVARLDSPTVLEVRRSGAGSPASACLTVGTTTVRVTASTGSGQQPADVDWTPDS